jgi:tetratricopeptide (TPR) repeat protein
MSENTPALPGRRPVDLWTLWALLATLVLAIVIVTPYFPLPIVATKTFVLATGAILTLALYVIARLSRGSVVLPPLVLVGALWLPVLGYLLSSTFSGVSFNNALWGTALESDTLGIMLAVATLGTLTAFVVRRAEHYASFLTVGAYLYAALSVVQVVILLVGQVSPETISPAFSLVGSYEDLAILLGLGVVSTLVAVRFFELERNTRRALTIATGLSLVIIAITNSTFVWAAVALGSLGLFIEAVMMRKQSVDEAELDEVALVHESAVEGEQGSHSMLPALLVLAVAVFFLLGGNLGSSLAGAFNVNLVTVTPSWQSTLDVAKQTYSTAPFFGTGPGSFLTQWLKYRDPSLNSTVFWNVDFPAGVGTIPTAFVTTGIVGAVTWILFLVSFLALGLRVLVSRTPRETVIRATAIIAFVATVYLFAALIFRNPSTGTLALAFVFAGLFASTVRFSEHARQRGIIFTKSPRMGFVIVFSLTLLLFGSIVTSYSLVGHYLSLVSITNASTAFSKGDLNRADQSLVRALSFAPSSAAYQAQANLAVARLNQIAASTTLKAADAQQLFQATLSSGINAAITATRLEPNNYQNWLTLGGLYAQAVPLNVSGAYDSAKTAYDKAKALHPTSPDIVYTIAQLDIAKKDYKAAEENLKAVIALKQDYTSAIFLLSQVEVQNGNVKEALDAALAAAYFAPKDANVLFQVGVLRAATSDYTGAAEALEAAIAVNDQFANARYFLAAVYAKKGDMKKATEQLQKIAAYSKENADAVAPMIAKLEKGTNPFPTNLLTLSPAPVQGSATPAP